MKQIVIFSLLVALTLFGLDAMALPSTFGVDFAAAETDATSGKVLVIGAVIGLAIISFGVGAVLKWMR